MQTSLKLDVYAGENLTGTLARSQLEEESYLFGYANGSGDQDAVSLTMPVVRDQYDSMNGLLPIFDMNLPEGALLEKLRNQFAKIIPQFDSLDLLAIVGQSQIGRLRYATSGTVPVDIPGQNLSELLAYAGAEDLFADLLGATMDPTRASRNGLPNSCPSRISGKPSNSSSRRSLYLAP